MKLLQLVNDAAAKNVSIDTTVVVILFLVGGRLKE